jgi:hypothetical protein
MASLWDQFTDTLSRGFDQVNPFDNGKDWNNRIGNPVVKKKKDERIVQPNMGNGPLRLPMQQQPTKRVPEADFTPAAEKPVQPAFGQVDVAYANKAKPAPKVAVDGSVIDNRPYPMRVPNDNFADANKALRGNTIMQGSNSSASAAQQLRAEMQQPQPNKARIQALTQQVRQNTTQQGKVNASNEQVRRVADTVATPVKVAAQVVNDFAVQPAINTALAVGDMGIGAAAGAFGNKALERASKQQFKQHFDGSPAGAVFNPLDVLGSTLGASAANADLYRKGEIDPNIIDAATNKQTAHVGMNTDMSSEDATLKLLQAAGETAMNVTLSGAGGKVKTKAAVPAMAKALDNPIEQLSKIAKNSLENDVTGMKPNGVERSGGFVENGTAKPVEVRRLEDGSTVIVDGRHTLEYARKNGITDYPIVDVTDKYAPKPQDLSPESQSVLTRLDNEIKKEDEVIRQEAEFEVERLQEKMMDPATTDEQVSMLSRQILDVKDQIKRLDAKQVETPIEKITEPVKKDTTLDGLKIDPNTTTRDRQGNLVDVNTGEILGTDTNVATKPPTAVEYAHQKLDEIAPELKADTRPIPERVSSLPDKAAAKIEDMPAIEQTKQSIDNELEALRETTTPEQRTAWAREMAQNSRDGSPLSPESQALQDQVQSLMDAFYGKSGRSLGDKRTKEGLYLPQATPDMIAGRGQTEFGSSFIDTVNSKFGFAETRKDAIELDDLADPIDTLKSYNEQWHYDNYGHLKQAEKLAAKGYVKPVEYLKAKDTLAEDTVASVDSELAKQLSREPGKVKTVNKKSVAKLDIAARSRENFDKYGNPEEIVINNARLPLGANAHTTREMWKKTGIYKDSGMNRYDNANGQGGGVFADMGGSDVIKQLPGDTGRQEYVMMAHGMYEQVYEADFKNIMDKGQFDEMVAQAATNAHRYESAQPFKALERSLAGEKILHYAERNRFTDKAVTKKFSNEVNYILKDSRRAKSLSDNVTNFLTSMYHTGALGLNPQSAVQQISELARVYGVGGEVDTIKGIYDAVRTMKPHEIRKFLDEYGIQDSYTQQMMNKADDVIRTTDGKVKTKSTTVGQKLSKGYDWVQEGTMKGFNAFETAKDVTLLKTLERKHANIADPYARRTAILDEFNRTALKGGHFGAIEATNRSNIARLGLQFGQYTMKDWGLMAEKAAQGDWGYVSRTIGGKAATAVPLYALFGTSIAFTLGLSEYKGGPAIGLATLTYTEIANENDRVKTAEETGKGSTEFNWNTVRDNIAKKQGALTVPGGNYLFNKLGVQELLPGLKDKSFMRDDTALSDMNRGYNQAQKGYNDDGKGNARFAVPQDPWNRFKMLLGGAYNSDQAHEYFNNGFFDLQFWGANNGGNQTLKPVSEKYQDKINKTTDQNAIAGIIGESRAQQAERDAYMKQDPKLSPTDPANKEKAALKAVWDEMNKTTWNKETQKNESDVISPERWKTVLGDKNGKMFSFMRDRAIRANKDFGDPIDPIFELKDQAQINDALTLRAAYTGDDKEKKSSLKEQQWYNDYTKKLTDYYDAKDTQAQDPNSDFGSTKRAQEYYQLSQANPYTVATPSPARAEYERIKSTGDEAARKAFYKANADVLGAEYEGLSKAAFDWTNKMRSLEGAAPITAEVWNNPTYGYKSDGINNGIDDTNNGYTKYSKGGSYSDVPLKTSSFGRSGASSAGEMNKVKVSSVKRKVRTRKGSSKGKITFKRSKTV